MSDIAKKPEPVVEDDLIEAPSRLRGAKLIYRAMMRGGGAPFGAPFEVGLASLTTKVVKLLKQTGFFGFETMEHVRRRNLRNKFTLHGAAPYVGEHGRRPKGGG